jgi:hypothetical protein
MGELRRFMLLRGSGEAILGGSAGLEGRLARITVSVRHYL